MANKGLLFKVDGVKKLTSANSDYELLNTRVANAMEVFYSFVETYPDSFASFFAGKGFQTSVYQGFSGTYANARNGYQKMGTNHLYFLEELRKSGLPPDSRTIQQNLAQYIDDRLVFAFAGDDLPIDRFFGVLITMNMHDPKEGFVLPEFKGEKHDESLTVIRETDDAFKALLEKIPDGTTLLVIGDHIPYHGLRSRHIPCLFYKKGEDLSVLNRKIPVDTVYTRCEMSQYVRRLFGMPDVSAHVPVCKK
jgi:phosphoglycerol transferase MdoB-like AlkP superfamily enzyme